MVDLSNHRVEKFDREGHFLLAFGSEGNGNGQFDWTSAGSYIAIDTNNSETTTDDRVYVGDKERIQVFDTEGNFIENWPDLGGVLAGQSIQSLAVDAEGNLYATYQNQPDVRKLTPTGEELGSPRFEAITPLPDEDPAIFTAVAVDSEGNVYAFGPPKNTSGSEIPFNPIYQFDAGGNLIANFGIGEFKGSTGLATNLCPGDAAPGNLYVSNSISEGSAFFVRAYGPEPNNCGKAITGLASNITETSATLNGKANPGGEAVTECFFEYGLDNTFGQTVPCAETSGEIGTGTEPVAVHADISGLTKGTIYHVRLVVGTAAGSEAGSDRTFKTLGPPVLSNELATQITFTEATLKAKVNPEGFATNYHFEYGPDATYGQSTAMIEIGSAGDRADHPVAANLEGLEPGSAYHWRIVATNSSGTTEGEDHVLTTYLRPSPEPCPNDDLRSGAAASLPDCRAYEMISPVEKNGGDIVHLFEAWVQVAEDGEKITYSAAPSFGDAQASVNENQYLASRDPKAGWSNHGIYPPVVGEHPVAAIFFGLFREFEGFTPDLCSAWFLDVMEPTLTPEGQDGFVNHYRFDLCGDEVPEALTTVPPPPGTAENYVNISGQSVAGYSADGDHALFSATAKLDEDAAAGTNAQIYDRFGDALHLVSIRPNGVADTNNTRVGSGPGKNLDNAVSSDGTYVYWTSGGDEAAPAGRIFLRKHPEQGKVEGECSDPAKACTVSASAGGSAFFWTAAADGSGAVLGEPVEGGEKLVEFDLQHFEADPKEARRTIASPVQGVLGASDDLARIYFVSTDVLTGAQENNEGDKAQAGQPNLYLDEGGAKTFIATLVAGDVGGGNPKENRAYDVVSEQTDLRATRVSPDGTHIAFNSRAQLSDFDNTDPDTGKPLVEVYTYQAGGNLNCVSCNPSGARAESQELPEPFTRSFNTLETEVQAAAWIPTWDYPFVSSHVLSDDGSRLFFNSYDALVPSDVNGAMDVYEWEAPGAGSCKEKSHAFHEANGGCLYLISSGESSFESEFWDASSDGRDVFFSTESSLLPKDPGSVDLYDARVGGGFPEPVLKEECEGETCQSPALPPQDPTPASAAYRGPGNVKANNKCPKGKHKVKKNGKTRCVKPKKGKGKGKGKKGQANTNRRAGR